MRANLLEIINGLHSIFPADFLLWKMSMAKEEGTLTAISKLNSTLDIRMYSFTQKNN